MTAASAARELDRRPWTGATREYDLFKELTVGVGVVGVIVLLLALVLGSPDDSPVTMRSWATAAPSDFVATSAAELAKSSDTATYGPPYSNTAGVTQTFGPLDLQSFSGVRLPIDTANTFVLAPLATLPQTPAPLATWRAAGSAQRTRWASAYADSIGKAPGGDPAKVASGDYGPVPAMLGDLRAMAESGGLDHALTSAVGGTALNPTATILFLGDGQYFNDLATKAHLTGDQWGVMNETGNYPGQAWLWLFSLWYQVPAIGNAPNADVLAVGIMGLLTLLLALIPFIPVLRSIPRWIPVHRLVWKDYYRNR